MRALLKSSLFIALFTAFMMQGKVWAQTFQNNNVACEEKQVVGSYQANGPWFNIINPHIPNQLVCGRFNDDSDLGATNFPDCVVLRDAEPFAFDGNGVIAPGSLSFIQNSGAHGENCFNAGGSSQFLDAETLYNVGFLGDSNNTFFLGSLVASNLDNDAQDFLDIAWLNLNGSFENPSNKKPSVQYLFSQASGGFAGPDVTPQNAFFEKQDYEYTPFPSYFEGPFYFKVGDQYKNQLSVDKSMVVADCNEDGFDDAILLAREDEDVDPGEDDDLNIMVSINNNGVLQTVSTSNNLTVLNDAIQETGQGNNWLGANLVSGDFDQDGHLDLIAITNQINHQFQSPTTNYAVFCQGNGACGFDCSTNDDSNILQLDSICINNCNPAVHSAISGDFNGDGRTDLAISDTRNQYLYYLWNDGGSIKNWKSESKTPLGDEFNAFPAPTYLSKGRFSTIAVQKGIDEVVASFVDANVTEYGEIGPEITQFKPKILFFPTDGQGGILPYEPMLFDLPKLVNPTGITASNFDRCGGDDVMVLAWQDEGQGIIVTSRASLFLNENEAPDLQTSATEVNGLVGQTVLLNGNCVDPTFDDRAFLWQATSSPAGAKPVFDVADGSLVGQNDTDITTNFTGDLPGEYNIELNCGDFCGVSVSKNIKVILSEEAGTDTTTGGTTGGGGGVTAISQGACMANLNGTDTGLSWAALPYGLLTLMLLAMLRWRFY